MTIDIYVHQQTVEVKTDWVPASDSVNVAKYRVRFSPDWDGLTRRLLWANGGKTVETLVTDEDLHLVPMEALQYGRLTISAAGDGEDTRLTTAQSPPIYIVRAGDYTGEDGADFTPTLKEQILALLAGNETGDGGASIISAQFTDGALVLEKADGGTITAELPRYAGAFEVTPLPEARTTMETGGTYLDRNVVVKEIPYYETGNASGGYTAIIGG